VRLQEVLDRVALDLASCVLDLDEMQGRVNAHHPADIPPPAPTPALPDSETSGELRHFLHVDNPSGIVVGTSSHVFMIGTRHPTVT
jgi:hypothetical protein